MAGRDNLIWSKFVSSTETLAFLPTLAAVNPFTGFTLKGSVSCTHSKASCKHPYCCQSPCAGNETCIWLNFT